MKIQVTEYQSHILAEAFAKTIHGEVISMHLRAVYGIWPVDLEYPKPGRAKRSDFVAVQASIRSITDPYDRLNFIAGIRHYFRLKCQEHRTNPKWQDYVASVKIAYADHQATLAAYERAASKREQAVFA